MKQWRMIVWISLGCLLGSACGASTANIQHPAARVASAAMPSAVDHDAAHQPVLEATPEANATGDEATCPADCRAPALLHGVTQAMRTHAYWHGDPKVIMDREEIAQFNARFYDPLTDLERLPDKAFLGAKMAERLASFQKKWDDDEIMFEDGSRLVGNDYAAALAEFLAAYDPSDVRQHVLLEDTTIFCAPHDRPYLKTDHGEVRFSRNQCSLGRAQARLEILFTHKNGMAFARTAEMWGWIAPDVKLSPPLPKTDLPEDARWFATQQFSMHGVQVPRGAFLAGLGEDVYLADTSGWQVMPAHALDGVIDTHRPLTQKDWIETLFLFLDDPYGWGGFGGWRDCSRLMLDVARSFGMRLPRNSKEQAVKTSLYFHVEGMSREDKLKKLDEAARLGIVLLHFPGHIMAYLGRADDGTPIVFHALSEYVQACDTSDASGQASLVHVDRVTLSDLTLGENTSRSAFIDRITHIAVLTSLTRKEDGPSDGPWHVLRDWSPQEEMLFSAFVERLFDYPDEPDKTWTNLGDVLRDERHNILYNALGLDEDARLQLRPDCADLPYMLRAYFAWKRGLPMGVRKCSRGTGSVAPKCGQPEWMSSYRTSGDAPTRFNHYAAYVGAYRVHSGNARTAHEDQETDFYPVALDRFSLRPGTTYADPYGHLFVIAHYRPDSADAPGALIAVDAQPDGTIAQKRFWKGNFLFDPEMKHVGAGFKAFRPIMDGRQMTNAELHDASGFVPFSTQQRHITKEEFYDHVESAIHAKPLDIDFLIKELTDSLLESAQRRVLSVQNGDDYIRANGAQKMTMPSGYAVFETTGPWEDFATPSRDMRLLMAIDAVMDLPSHIRRNAKRYGLEREEALENAVVKTEQALDAILRQSFIQYQNSAGEFVQLSLKTMIERAAALEMAYHPADCNEIRWGEPAASEAYKTCTRRANPAERAKMEKMRVWFKKRVRPPR